MAKLPTTLTVTVAGAKTIEALAMLYDICRRMDAEGCAARPDEDEYQSAMEKALSALTQHQVEFLAAAPAAPVQAQGEPASAFQRSAPERIWLMVGDVDYGQEFDDVASDGDEWAPWVLRREHDDDVPYVRADLAHPPRDAELTRLRAENARQRGLLLWALYHAQGGSSPVGQPIRKALGIGQFDSMTPEQIHEAKVAAQGEQ